MFDRERLLCADMTAYAHRLIADLPDERMAEQPAAGLNHAAWTLGHLVIATDGGLRLCGHAARSPRPWQVLFGPGSQPAADRSRYPTKTELVEAFTAGYQAFLEAVVGVTAATAAAVNPSEPMRGRFPTVGDMLGYLLTTHIGMHTGQLSAWRRVCGYPSV